MRYFPIFYDLKDCDVVIVGGGEEALRKVRLLLKTEARINVVAPRLYGELAAEPRVTWLAREFRAELLDNATLVFVADPVLNGEVAAAARSRGIPVNVVDTAEISTFITPSIVDRDPVVVAIGTEGTAPVLGQGIRAKIEAFLPVALGELAVAARDLRSRVAAAVPQGSRRRAFWQRFFFGTIREAFLAGDAQAYPQEIEAALASESTPARGRVSFVGAGPGDPELLTLKAHRKLQEADVIVFDRLLDTRILEFARRDAVRVPVGKATDRPAPQYPDITNILIGEARAGKIVVRLAIGDQPAATHFSAERAALVAAGIPVDVVPGIAAATRKARRPAEIIAFPDRDNIRETLLRAAS